MAGVLVTPQTALTFSAFFAAVNIISTDLSTLPFLPFQSKNGYTRLATEHSLYRRFGRSPDSECSSENWMQAWTAHVLTWGNGYAKIGWSPEGEVEGMQLIHPSLILPKRDQRSSKLYYEIQTAESVAAPSGKRRIAPWEILHYAGLGFNGLVGYSPVALMREAIGTGKSYEQLAASFAGNGTVMGGVFTFARSMKPEAIKNFRENVNLVHQGSAAGFKNLILEEGTTYQTLGMPLKDAEFIAQRAFQRLEIAMIYRIPPWKMADYTDAHLDNMETSNEDYIISCLRPWAVLKEAACKLRLLTEDEWLDGYYMKHDFRPLWLKSSKDKADYYQKMFQVGYYTVDEIKALEGENPIGDAKGGSKRFVMANLADITKAGDPAQAQQAKPAEGDAGRPERNRIEPYLNGTHA